MPIALGICYLTTGFQAEQSLLDPYASRCGKTTGLPGSHHPVAGDDDRAEVAFKSLANGPCGPGFLEGRGYFCISLYPAIRYRGRVLKNPAGKRRVSGKVDGDLPVGDRLTNKVPL